MLRLPVEGEEPPPLMRGRISAHGAEISDETGDEELTAGDGEKSPVLLLVGMFVVGTVLLAGFWQWMKAHSTIQPPFETAVEVSSPAIKPAEEKVTGPDRFAQSEEVIRKFLNAGTMEEALKYVYQPERTRQRWTAWLNGEPYVKPGVHEVQAKSMVTLANFVSAGVVTEDYATKLIAVRFEGETGKVDWESWAGWSEMSWEEFLRTKPTEPKAFRVILSKVDYYNFDFADERKWSAYRLDSPDAENSLYGYAEAGGEVDNKIRPLNAKQSTPELLMIHFLPGATGNQVVIDRSAGRGWLEP